MAEATAAKPVTKLLAPCIVDIKKSEDQSFREDLLWNLQGNMRVPEVASKLCAQHRLPLTEEKDIDRQLERQLRGFRDASSGGPLVSIALSIPLDKEGHLVLVDRPIWDLNSPRFMVELYATALCRDLGLGIKQFAAICNVMKGKLEACRQDLKAGGGKTQLVAPPQVVKREHPVGYPCIVRIPSSKRAKPEGAAGGEGGSSRGEGGAGVAISPAATPVKAEPGDGPLQPPAATAAAGGAAVQSQEGRGQQATPPEGQAQQQRQPEVKQEVGGSGEAAPSQPGPDGGGVVAVEEGSGEDSDMPDLGI